MLLLIAFNSIPEEESSEEEVEVLSQVELNNIISTKENKLAFSVNNACLFRLILWRSVL